jgi:hypothetical protein
MNEMSDDPVFACAEALISGGDSDADQGWHVMPRPR